MDLGSAGGSAGNWLDEEGWSLAGWALLHIVSHAPESGKSRGCQVTRGSGSQRTLHFLCKHEKRSAQIQEMGKWTPSLDGRGCEVTLQRGLDPGRRNNLPQSQNLTLAYKILCDFVPGFLSSLTLCYLPFHCRHSCPQSLLSVPWNFQAFPALETSHTLIHFPKMLVPYSAGQLLLIFQVSA